MNKFYVKAALALASLCSVTYLAHQMLFATELPNRGEVGILLGILSAIASVAWKGLFEHEKRDDE